MPPLGVPRLSSLCLMLARPRVGLVSFVSSYPDMAKSMAIYTYICMAVSFAGNIFILGYKSIFSRYSLS